MKKTCFINLLVFAFTATAMASVLAPSKIVVTSVSNNSDEFVKNKYSDNTVKAIIYYPLTDVTFINDHSEILMFLEPTNSDDPIEIRPESVRYCIIDSNLIVEFNHTDVVDGLLAGGFSGLIEIEVAGNFFVRDDSEEYGIPFSEKFDLFVYNRPNNR